MTESEYGHEDIYSAPAAAVTACLRSAALGKPQYNRGTA